MKIAWIITIMIVLCANIALAQENLPVPQCYMHGIESANDLKFLELQMSYLNSSGYRTITIDEYDAMRHGKLNLTGKLIMFTIDDGPMSGYTNISPVLSKYGFKANLAYAKYTPWLKQLTPDQIRALKAKGWYIGAHSMVHKNFLKISNISQIIYELNQSKAEVKKITGQDTMLFVFPENGATLQLTALCNTFFEYCMGRSNYSHDYVTTVFENRELGFGRMWCGPPTRVSAESEFTYWKQRLAKNVAVMANTDKILLLLANMPGACWG